MLAAGWTMGIAARIRGLVLVAVSLTAGVIFVVVFWGYGTVVNHVREAGLRREVELEGSRIQYRFQSLKNDVALVGSLPQLATMQTATDDVTQQRAKDDIAIVLTQLLKRNPTYTQARVLSGTSDAHELVRVQRSNGGVLRVVEEELQDKGDRDYIQLARQRGPGEVVLSDITLNRERGKVEVPHQPTVRAVFGVLGTTGEVTAFAVINQAFDEAVQSVVAGVDEQFSTFIVNHNSDYLVHPDPAKTFGFDLGRRFRAVDDMGESWPDWTSSSVAGPSCWQQHGAVSCFERVELFDPPDSRFVVFGISSADAPIASRLDRLALQAAGLGLLLSVLGFAIAWRLAGRLTRPLAAIATEAARVERGAVDVQLPVDRSDEIGVLSRSLSVMLESLRTKERELNSTNEELQRINEALEQFAHAASHDLREPATRIAAFAELIERLEDKHLSEQGKDWLRRMGQTARALLSQVTDFRILTGISDGQVHWETVDVPALFEAANAQWDSAAARVELIVDGDPPRAVRACKSLIEAMFRVVVEQAVQDCQSDHLRLKLEFDDVERARAWVIRDLSGTHALSRSSGIRMTLFERIVVFHGGSVRRGEDSGGVWIRFSLQSSHSHDAGSQAELDGSDPDAR